MRIRRREPHRLNSVSIAAPARQQHDAWPRWHSQAIHQAAVLAEEAGSCGRLWHPLLPTPGTACGHGFGMRRRWWAAVRDRVDGWQWSACRGHFEARGRVAGGQG